MVTQGRDFIVGTAPKRFCEAVFYVMCIGTTGTWAHNKPTEYVKLTQQIRTARSDQSLIT